MPIRRCVGNKNSTKLNWNTLLHLYCQKLNPRPTAYRPWLARYSFCALVVTLLLLYAGGFTTTIGAGMVFPDWPLSNGSLNPDGWIQDQAMAAEHSHRLLGMVVGNITLILAIWIWCVEGRSWMRRLGVAAIILVIIQGVLGGIRVLENEVNYAIVHGCLGQLFFCLLTVLAIAQTKAWHNLRKVPRDDRAIPQTTGLLLIGLLFIQLVVAAIMRHKGAGLAIPTFPLTPEGKLIPTDWYFGISIHFAHRALAVIITVAYTIWVAKLFKATTQRYIRGLAVLACALLIVQVAFGAAVIWMGRTPFITTMHVLNSAFLLATTWGAHFFCYHHALENPLIVPNQSTPSTQTTENPQAISL